MAFRLLACGILALAPTSVESGGAAVPACIVGCQAAFWGGVVGSVGPQAPVTLGLTAAGYAACMAGCNALAIGATCFDGANLVSIKNGTKRVSELKPGDLIATTSASGELAYTHVAQNELQKSEGAPFGFKQVMLESGKSFNVTDEHFVVVEAASGELQIKRAEHVHIGDVMVSQGGERSRVDDLGSFAMDEKWTLGTASGTAMVNGVLMTAVCDTIAELPTNFPEAMQTWRDQHKHWSDMDSLFQVEHV